MNFGELRFWQYLATGLAVILAGRALCRKLFPRNIDQFDKAALLGLGLFLLGCVSWVTLIVFLAVAVASYLGLQWILAHQTGRYRYLLVVIPLQLLPLFYFKYSDFFVNKVFGLDVASLHHLLIPVGISFYTFQKVAFVMDTLVHKRPLPRFLDYMNFAGFFPQIVAGPIERRDDLLPQMEQFRITWQVQNINDGAGWIALGLFFKCALADNFALYFKPDSTDNAWLIWLANLVFGLRIYYDFAGYSLVAVGLARCLGVRLTVNFASPYCATSVAEFWRRWHITLSQWFRDYLYVPLGGGRVRWWALNVAVVFLLSGVWHGAGWNFVLWGALHGAYLIFNRLAPQRLHVPSVLGWFATMLASFLAWLCFYEVRTGPLLAKFTTVFSPSAYSLTALRGIRAEWTLTDLFVLGGLLALAGLTLLLEWQSVARKNDPYCFLRRPAVLACAITLTLWLAPGKNNAFIYFAF